jgi:hypothetical protein
MQGYNVKAALNDNLSNAERNDVLEKVRKVPGVLSAHFTESAAKKEIFVHANLPGNIDQDLAKIQGVKEIKPVFMH